MTIGRAFTDTFAGIAPGSLPGFIAAQLVGAVIGLALVALVFAVPRSGAGDGGGALTSSLVRPRERALRVRRVPR